MKVSGPTMKEIVKNPPQSTDKDNAKGSAKKKDKGAEKAPVKEKPKRKGPLDVIPHTLEEWAVYDVPDEVTNHFHCNRTSLISARYKEIYRTGASLKNEENH